MLAYCCANVGQADLDEITAVTRLQARYRGRKVRHVRQGMQDMELDRPVRI